MPARKFPSSTSRPWRFKSSSGGSHQLAGHGLFAGGAVGGSLDGKGLQNYRHHALTRRAVGKLAALGGDGIGESSYGVARALLCGRSCQAWYHRQLTEPGVIFCAANLVDGGVLVGLPPEVQQAINSWHGKGWCPSRRTETPQDVANATMLICMEEASWMTGQIFYVDGGASIMDTIFPLEI
jgi:hypothetical protein